MPDFEIKRQGRKSCWSYRVIFKRPSVSGLKNMLAGNGGKNKSERFKPLCQEFFGNLLIMERRAAA